MLTSGRRGIGFGIGRESLPGTRAWRPLTRRSAAPHGATVEKFCATSKQLLRLREPEARHRSAIRENAGCDSETDQGIIPQDDRAYKPHRVAPIWHPPPTPPTSTLILHVFAAVGVTATDAPADLNFSNAWAQSAQWTEGLEDLFHPNLGRVPIASVTACLIHRLLEVDHGGAVLAK